MHIDILGGIGWDSL